MMNKKITHIFKFSFFIIRTEQVKNFIEGMKKVKPEYFGFTGFNTE